MIITMITIIITMAITMIITLRGIKTMIIKDTLYGMMIMTMVITKIITLHGIKTMIIRDTLHGIITMMIKGTLHGIMMSRTKVEMALNQTSLLILSSRSTPQLIIINHAILYVPPFLSCRQ